MPSSPPVVSIVIPCYGVEGFVKEAVQSALDQVGVAVEVIAVNDGSKDNTLRELRSFGDQICLIDQPNAGVSAARNAGGLIARGRAILFLDGDDVLELDAAQTLYTEMDRTNAGVVYGELVRIDENSTPLPSGMMGYRNATGNAIAAVCGGAIFQPAAALVQADLFRLTGGFDQSLTSSEDYDFQFRCALRGEFFKVQRIVGRYRIRANSNTRNYPATFFTSIQVQDRYRKAHRLLWRYPFHFIYGRLKFGFYFAAEHWQSRGSRSAAVQESASAALRQFPWLWVLLICYPILSKLKRLAATRRRLKPLPGS